MIITFIFVLVRIFTNSMSNVYQKQLTTNGISPFFINFVMYFGLCLISLPLFVKFDYMNYSYIFWLNSFLGGLFGAIGNCYLVMALQNGELSVLGPINAYKSVVAMIFGIILIQEKPSLLGVFAILLIILGSYFIFETQKEGFSLSLLRRRDIRYRIYALIFTAIEAVFIKNVIMLSDINISFLMWCFWGAVFMGISLLVKRRYSFDGGYYAISRLFLIIVLMGLMQYCTNFVFSKIQVSYGLALFQLSSLLSVILGWKYFNEKDILKKLIGSFIMVLGAIILILFN